MPIDPEARHGAEILHRLQAAGTDPAVVTAEFERARVRSFCDSYHHLLDCIESKVQRQASVQG